MNNQNNSYSKLTIEIAAAIISALLITFHQRKKILKKLKGNNSIQNEIEIKNTITKIDPKDPFIEKHPQGFGEMIEMPDIKIDHVYLLPVENLYQWLPEESCNIRNIRNIKENTMDKDYVNNTDVHTNESKYNKIMTDEDVVLGDIRRHPSQKSSSRAYLRAGPRSILYFNPIEVKAAIVTCGGLCPGLNNVIRDLTRTLWDLYNVRTIYGICNGFNGFHNWTSLKDKNAPLMLNPSTTSGIHHWGGTILGSNRGGFDLDKIVSFLIKYEINQLFVIGGDGTHRGANKIAKEIKERKLRITIAGIPKTIDNDVDLLDRSFGFNTAVEEAQRAIRSAKVESKCVPNGIGIVKLMGRSAGFIAAHASLSSGDVNLCLIPEIPIIIDPNHPLSCLKHVHTIIKERGSAVVVVAEGAGEELLAKNNKENEYDKGGNKKLQPIGEYIKDQLIHYFNNVVKEEATIKYIDPSYMIRSVPANAADSLYCMLLAQNAVHGAMAGYTGFTVGLSGNRVVYLPIEAVTKNSPRCVDPMGRTWERVLCLTRQPNTYIEQGKLKGARNSNPPI